MTRSVRLVGQALWSPGFASFDAFRAGERDDSITKPAISLVQSRMKRATSLMTRMAVECVVGAAEDADIALNDCATFFGSEHGEIQIAVDQMAMMQDGDGRISPARFKNSVHNTAAGLFSIAAKNQGFTTAIAAGADTFALSLLEAIATLQAGDADRAIVSIADESLPPPIDRYSEHPAFCIALALAVDAEGPSLTLPVRDDGQPTPLPDALEMHAAGPAYRLLAAWKDGRIGDIALSERWKVTLA